MRDIRALNKLFVTIKNIFVLFILSILAVQPATAQEQDRLIIQEILSDKVISSANQQRKSGPDQYIGFNDKTIFKSTTIPAIMYLSDGTASGTTEFSFPEWSGLDLYAIGEEPVFNGKLYFRVYAKNGDNQIWLTDGTKEGTEMVVSGVEHDFSVIRSFHRLGDTIVIQAYNKNISEDALYFIDTTNNTVRIAEETGKILAGFVRTNAVMGDYYYYVISDGKDRKLMRIDEQGNVDYIFKSNPSTGDIGHITFLTPSPQTGKLYFQSVENGGLRYVLWVYESNTGVTKQLFSTQKKDGSSINRHTEATYPIAVGDLVYFHSKPWISELNDGRGDFSNGRSLYVTDGTNEGTKRALINRNIEFARIDGKTTIANHMLAFNNSLVFSSIEAGSSSFQSYILGSDGEVKRVMLEGETLYLEGTATSLPLVLVRDKILAFISRKLISIDENGEAQEVGNREDFDDGIVAYNEVNGSLWVSARRHYKSGTRPDVSVWQVLPENEWVNPAIPQLKYPENAENDVSAKPELRWRKVTNADGYRVQISTGSLFYEEGILIDENSVTDSVFEVETDLAYNKTHYWRVQAYNEQGVGEWSDGRRFTTQEKPADLPDIPAVPTLNLPEDESELEPYAPNSDAIIYFHWSRIPEADSYQLQLSASVDFDDLVLDTSLVRYDMRLKQEMLESETKYFWRVKAANEDGSSNWSKIFSFYNPEPALVSIEDESLPTKFTLSQNYPNPFNPSTNIKFALPQNGHTTLIVYDILGQEITTLVNGKLVAGEYTIRFDALGLANGIYFYKLRANNREIIRKMTLIK